MKKKVNAFIKLKYVYAYYEENFLNYFKFENKIKIIEKKEFIDKMKKSINIDKFEIIFGEEASKVEFFDEFEKIIEKVKQISSFIISNKKNIEKIISKLNELKCLIEQKKDIFKIYISDKDIYDKFVSESNIDIDHELNEFIKGLDNNWLNCSKLIFPPIGCLNKS